MDVLFRLIRRIIGCQWPNGPDRKLKLELGCLGISVRSGGSRPVGPGRVHIGVSIYKGGPGSSDISNYRTPMENWTDRKRKLGLGCLEISVMSGGPAPLGFGRFPIVLAIYQGGSVSSDTSNYRAPRVKRDRSKAETGTALSGNICYVRRLRGSGFRALPDRCGHLPGRFCFI